MKNVRLSHKLSLKLVITPQIRQALYILQLPYPALGKYLEQRIAENPILQPLAKENSETRLLGSKGSNPSYNQYSFNKDSDALTQNIENQKSKHAGLQEYLFQQLRMTFLNEDELSIAQELIHHIDNNGYLRISTEQFAKEHDFSLDKIEAILETIQSLEPSGIGARNLQECLLIQLKNNEQEQSLAYKVIQLHFKELAKKAYQTIAKKLRVNLEDVERAVKKIKTLNPRPGTVIAQEENNAAIIPDIFVKVRGSGIRLMLNDDNLPRLRVNPYYKKLLTSSATSKETEQFIKERLKSALWLIKAVEQRQNNIIKVMGAIAESQKQAICKDLSCLKPLRLKDIAHKTGLHLSTVARIVSHKYIATPQGTIRAKDLFSSRLSLNKGGITSRRHVLFKIQNIIFNDKQAQLSDRNITEALRKEGIRISRRTVTKYRNLLKIPPAFLR